MEGFPASDWLTEGRRATPAEVEVDRERANAALQRLALMALMEEPDVMADEHPATQLDESQMW